MTGTTKFCILTCLVKQPIGLRRKNDVHTAKVEITLLETRLEEIQSSGASGVIIAPYLLDKIVRDLKAFSRQEVRKGNKSANVLAI